ncbi:hypothetical protein HYH02_013299 [Chlamydomonas schloesseri]|uniref:Uncharacterized protein n=1 Tax=Chlamydomonas schloesseri TaxID=2026947 RepID=A0A835W0F7_9CHLO|nr:hypothetical protein HYH02_013299 [Chlamydomonas schloesseri]|eukprot:KAG2431606.1 hypothetical protein HYH02_013299 [Chlamydomonas schloesseri]
MPMAGTGIRPVREPEERPVGSYTALEGDVALSRQLAAQTNNKRTPTGHFFSPVNPALHEKQVPPATYDGGNITHSAVATMRGSGLLQPGGTGRYSQSALASDAHYSQQQQQQPEAIASAYYGAGGSSSAPVSPAGTGPLPPITTNSFTGGSTGGLGSTGKRASWNLPWQTGDRTLGRQMADQIRYGRTPIGAFANRDLAKPNK